MQTDEMDRKARKLSSVIELVGGHSFLHAQCAKNKSKIEAKGDDSDMYLSLMQGEVGIPYIQGAPGGGKTASISAMCAANHWGLVSTHFALKPIEETGGIPDFQTVTINGKPVKGTIWTFPDIMAKLFETSEKYNGENELVVWLLDDAHLCTQMHYALMYELYTERTLRGYKLPDNVAIVMAGNTSNKAGAKMIFSAIVNRCCMMPVFTDFNDWKTEFAIPFKVHPAVLSFLSNEHYTKFFHEEEETDTAWGSPRSWTRFANYLSHHEMWRNGEMMAPDLAMYLATGYVGQDAAVQFTNYYQIFSKWDLEKIIKDSANFKIPADAVDSYALAHALTSKYMGAGDKNRKGMQKDFATIIHKYFKNEAEFAIMMMKEIIQVENALGKHSVSTNLLNEIQKIDPDLVISNLKMATSI